MIDRLKQLSRRDFLKITCSAVGSFVLKDAVDILGGIERQLYPTTVMLRSPETGQVRSGVIVGADPGRILTSGHNRGVLEVYNSTLMDNAGFGMENITPFHPNASFKTENQIPNTKGNVQSLFFNQDFGGNSIDWADLQRRLDFNRYSVAKISTVTNPREALILGFGPDGYSLFRYVKPRQKGFSQDGELNLEVSGLPSSMVGAGVFSAEDSGLLGIVTSVEANKVVVKSVINDLTLMTQKPEALVSQRNFGYQEPR